VKDVRDELKEGDQLLVKVINIDPSGKVRLSRKALLERPEGMPPEPEGGGEHHHREGGHGERREHRGGHGRGPRREHARK
jgi:polyribonucleotide nucleotidyltransferase